MRNGEVMVQKKAVKKVAKKVVKKGHYTHSEMHSDLRFWVPLVVRGRFSLHILAVYYEGLTAIRTSNLIPSLMCRYVD